MRGTHRAANALRGQARFRGSEGLMYGRVGEEGFSRQQGWARQKARGCTELEILASASTKADERVEQLFGVDHVPWVTAVKDTNNDGKVDPDRRMLWEKAVYTQSPDLRNDWAQKWSQGAPRVVGGADAMTQGDIHSRYLGMYPNRLAETPGKYWKDRFSKHLYSHVIQEQELDRESEMYGGAFGLPTDDYQTHNGVSPLLGAADFRKLKYDVHEKAVRELNAATEQGTGLLGDIIRNNTSGKTRELAVKHQALTIFWKSIRPNGGPLRPEFAAVLEEQFGGRKAFESNVVQCARQLAAEDGYVWLVYDTETKGLAVVATALAEHPIDIKGSYVPLASLVLLRDIWEASSDSTEEAAERFNKALDYDYVYASYCTVTGGSRPEPLVF